MKRFVIFLILSIISVPIFSQQLSTVELIKALMNVDAIFKYRNFKKDFQQTVVEITQNDKLKNNPETYYKLQKAYNETKKEYDGFLIVIKSDISDFNSVMDMTKKPGEYAQKYLNAYTRAANYYESNFIPVYTQIISQETASRGLFTPKLLKLSIDGFSILVEYIQKRGRNKEESYNFILSQVNNLFFNPLKLAEWNELVTYVPNGAVPENTAFSNVANETYVPYSTLDTMKGFIEFNYIDEYDRTKTDIMEFSYKQLTRDLTIGKLNTETEYKGDNFKSVKPFPENTSFKIKVKNTAFLYVFAVNSDNTCYNIYPYSDEWVQVFSLGRDLSIGNLGGRDDENVTVIPGKNIKTGEPNYINISGNSKEERLCIVISKSELDIKDVYSKIDNVPGTVYERLNAVFVDNIISAQQANLKVESGRITFDATNSDKSILPLLFIINRK